MKREFPILLLTFGLLAAPASADDAAGLAAPRAGVQFSRGPRPGPTEPAQAEPAQEDSTDEEASWEGPAVQLGYSRYQLVDGEGGGRVQALSLGGFFPTGPVRAGLAGEFGRRGYALAGDDVLIRGTLHFGYQQLSGLGPFHPYLSAVATYGWVLGKRFHTPVSDGLSGGGFELGADLVVARTLHIGLAYSYLRVRHQGLGHGLHLMRLTIGL